jgi:galactose mutarotase-like enzyme
MRVIHNLAKVAGFEIHTLSNEYVSITIAPELGGRIVSLKHLESGREWLDGWEPAANRRISRPSDPADFETGPGAGLDECLPTVLPCMLGGARLGDHGELWNQVPAFDEDLANKGVFACQWALKSLPLAFERRISIHGNEIRFQYRIGNCADTATPFLWAWHPLFTLAAGDQILTSEKSCFAAQGERPAWPHIQPGTDLSRAEFPADATPAAKVFLGPLARGHAAITSANGATLTLDWPAELFPYAGIWITRGFWKGLHHWAIEPTNAPVDCLSDITEHSRISMLVPDEVREWTLTVKLTPGRDSEA